MTLTDAEALAELRAAFAACPRPERFTDFRHCCECAEHDELLRSRDVDTLGIEDVGNPGWDPLCFTSAEGLLYYLPALGRLALAEPAYPAQLHFHLTYDGGKNRILVAASPAQRRVVARFLRHIVEARPSLCEDLGLRDELLAAAALWEAAR